MNKPEMLSRFLKGSRLTYLGAMSAVLGNVFVSAITPMVIKSTLDNILGDEPVATRLGAWLINGAGGVERIRANLWIILLVLIGMTLVQGVFQFLRAKLAALTGENSAKRMRDRIFLHVLRQPFDTSAGPGQPYRLSDEERQRLREQLRGHPFPDRPFKP